MLDLVEAKNYIYSIDFSKIIMKMIAQGWLKKDAELTCRMYQNYLYLNRKYSEKYILPPTHDIDEFWHNHILDTEKYHNDCLAIFGRYFHHDPNIQLKIGTVKEMEKHFEIMLELYRTEFGQHLYQVRSFWKKLFGHVINFFSVRSG